MQGFPLIYYIIVRLKVLTTYVSCLNDIKSLISKKLLIKYEQMFERFFVL